MDVLAGLAALAVLIGLGQGLAGWLALRLIVCNQYSRCHAAPNPVVPTRKSLGMELSWMA
jgi:hypothetical protein